VSAELAGFNWIISDSYGLHTSKKQSWGLGENREVKYSMK